MKTITVTKPLILKPSDITEPTVFDVQADLGGKYAVTIEGNWRRNQTDSEDRFDGLFPVHPIVVKCNYLSPGVLVKRDDNSTFTQITVVESKGKAIQVLGCRQSTFGVLRAHRCQSPDSIISITGLEDSFSPNMLRFGAISCMANDAPVTVELVNAPGSKNAVRVIDIGSLWCHIAWPSMAKQFPVTAQFGPRARTHLALNDSVGVGVSVINCRMHRDDPPEAKAITAGPKAENCVIHTGQVLQVRGKSIANLISGNVTVFPQMKA